nr:response regulator [Roseibium sp. RKSG952]
MTERHAILIVDDSPIMRKLARRTLECSRFKFDITEVDNAEAALRAIASNRFKLVLTDFHMPGIDGLELAGAIRELSSKIAVYMMSTNDTTYLERSAAFVGISGFLQKPFAPEDIDTLMHNLLGLECPEFAKSRDAFRFLERERKATEDR